MRFSKCGRPSRNSINLGIHDTTQHNTDSLSHTLLRRSLTPPPCRLDPQSSEDERKMEDALRVLLVEDPSLSVGGEEERGGMGGHGTLLSGLGELHLEVTKDR